MHRQRIQIVLALVCALGPVGCGGSASSTPSAPSAPSPASPVVPQPNQIQMAGTVSDSAFRPLGGASVEVVDGPQAGKATIADARGEFSLSGTFDDTTRFRATKDGHLAATATLGPFCATCRPNRWIHFHLAVLAPPVNLAGAYTLTFIADSSCAAIPDELRTRIYQATITPASYPDIPAGTQFDVALSGARFFQDYRSLSINVAANYVAFWLGDLHGSPSVVEQVAANTYVAFGGWAEASLGTAVPAFSTAFDGFIDYCALKSEMGSRYDCTPGEAVAHARCESKNHRLIVSLNGRAS